LIEIMLSLIASAAAGSARRTMEAARPRALVVWLRRFHQAGYDRFPIKDLFEQLSAWGLLVYTLSDDVIYKSSLAERDIRKWVRARVTQLPQGAKYASIRSIIQLAAACIGFLGIVPVLLTTRNYSGLIQLASVLCFIAAVYLSSAFAIKLLLNAFYRSKAFRELYKPIFAQAMADSFSMSAAKAQAYFKTSKREFSIAIWIHKRFCCNACSGCRLATSCRSHSRPR
jgi:hypothetical protein